MDIQFKQTLKIFSVLFGVLIFGVLLGVSLVRIGYTQVQPSGTEVTTVQEKQNIAVDLMLDYGNGDVQSFSDQVLQSDDTVLDLLEQSGVSLEKRSFPGMGMFIEAINGVHNSNNYYWQFWVNGEYAKVAAEKYVLEDGDKVLWKRTNEIEK